MRSAAPPRSPPSATTRVADFRLAGAVFLCLGLSAALVAAMAIPAFAPTTAWILVIWGLAGLVFAAALRAMAEWRPIALIFAALLAAGLALMAFPERGDAFLTAAVGVVLLLDGTILILVGLRLSGQVPGWRWLVASGAGAYLLAAIVLVLWPVDAGWMIDLLIAAKFLSTGTGLLGLSRRSQHRGL